MSEPDTPTFDTDETPDETPAATASAAGFAGLGLRPQILDRLAELGYEEPTPIQAEAIPQMLTGVDMLGQAATGTGKTAAFALPILQAIEPGAEAVPQALVVVPTRELAVQVSEAMHAYGRGQGLKVVPIYGGQPIPRQLQALRRGVHVVVATPGRAIDHIRRGSLELDAIRTVVLDEADEMLDMGFTEDIETILEETPAERQTVLFSATMPPRIRKIAETYQRDPVLVKIAAANTAAERARVRQTAYMVMRQHKANALGRVLDMEAPVATIVFCRTRGEVDELTATMNGRGYRAEALHGGMDQQQRDRVMGRLKDGTAELLVATDVAARGLDVDTLTHVVNYDVPSSPESYVHRIGRVGRAGREGVAITLAEPRQRRLLQNIERLTKQEIDIQKIPTVGDLRERQVAVTVEAIREALLADDLDDYETVLFQLIADGNPDRDVALAAIKLFHQARGATTDEVEIPDASERKPRDRDRDRGGKDGKGRDRERGPKGQKRGNVGPGTGLIYVGVGRRGHIRPGDLVGCIANETNLTGRDIGPIRISEHYSVVGVPEADVESTIHAINNTVIRGKKAKARRFVEKD